MDRRQRVFQTTWWPGIMALALMLVACGGGSSGPQARDRASPVRVEGPRQVGLGATIVWRVDMPDQPADDPPSGYAITLPEAAARINIATRPCDAPATTGCQVWTLTAAADAVPGQHFFSIEPQGMRARVTSVDLAWLEVVDAAPPLQLRAIEVASDGGSLVAIATDASGGALGLYGRGANQQGQLASGYLAPPLASAGVDAAYWQMEPGLVPRLMPLQRTRGLTGPSELRMADHGLWVRSDGALHAWGRQPALGGIVAPTVFPGPALPQAYAPGRVTLLSDRERGALHAVFEPDRFAPGYRVKSILAPDGQPLDGVTAIAVDPAGAEPLVLVRRQGLGWWRVHASPNERFKPHAVAGLPGDVVEVALDRRRDPVDEARDAPVLVLARDTGGLLWSWVDGVGQPGQPQRVPGIDDVRSQSLYGDRAWAVRGDGTVWSWILGQPPQRAGTLQHARRVSGNGWVITAHCSEGDGGVWQVAASGHAAREPGFGVDCGRTSLSELQVELVGEGGVDSEPSGLTCEGAQCRGLWEGRPALTLRATGRDGRAVQRFEGDCRADPSRPGVAEVSWRVGEPSRCRVVFEAAAPPHLNLAVVGPGRVRDAAGRGDIDCPDPGPNNGCESGASSLELQAIPGAGAVFVGWSGACSGATTSLVLRVDGPVSCTATFAAAPTVQVQLQVQGGGRVTGTPAGIDCPGACSISLTGSAGATLVLTAAPAAGQRFSGWSGDCSGSTAVLTLGLERSRSCTAVFVPVPPAQLLLSVTVDGVGRVVSSPSGIDCSGSCSASFAAGTVVTLTAEPGNARRFDGWAGSCSGSTVTTSIELAAAASCSARFVATGSGDGLPSGNLLVDPGFESSSPAAAGLPTAVGRWQGDLSERVASGSRDGIEPHGGSAMLRFVATGAVSSTNTLAGQMWQLVDLRAWADRIDAGNVRADGRVWFNRVAGGVATDRRFDLRLLAFDGVAVDVPARYAANQALAQRTVTLDSVADRWQRVDAQLVLPARTRWLLFEIYAFEDVRNDNEPPEFDGHFADDASLVLVRP